MHTPAVGYGINALSNSADAVHNNRLVTITHPRLPSPRNYPDVASFPFPSPSPSRRSIYCRLRFLYDVVLCVLLSFHFLPPPHHYAPVFSFLIAFRFSSCRVFLHPRYPILASSSSSSSSLSVVTVINSRLSLYCRES